MAYETMLRYHCDHQTGVFPTDSVNLLDFSSFFTQKVQQLDIVGLFGVKNEARLMEQCFIQGKPISYLSTEPDRSIPYDATKCYLPFFRHKKILIISPFASFLATRYQKDIFESVWSKISIPWFEPTEVKSLDIPYSYVSVPQTRVDYATSHELYLSICNQLSEMDFDIALIGAGALGIPLASFVKEQGKVGLSLGGHNQVIVGVKGKRWEDDLEWQENYITSRWVSMPTDYMPTDKEKLTDGGAYW
jgi:hypothetical protein